MRRGKYVMAAVVGGFLLSAITEAGDNAVIKGKIIFEGDVAKYKRSVIKTDKDPNCKKAKKRIGSEKVIINKKTVPKTLRNVMVYVKSGLRDAKFEAKTEPVILNQLGCQYVPHVVAMMASQPLRVTNGDETNHNIHLLPKVNLEMNFSQPKKGMKKDLTLQVEDVFKAKCDVHPWMGCYIRVFDHPFFAVTGKAGTFEIKNLPAGKYSIEAWHEEFGTQTVKVIVAQDETKEVDITFKPE